jgi:hypothetical protein
MASDVRIPYAADQQSSVLIVNDELAVARATAGDRRASHHR